MGYTPVTCTSSNSWIKQWRVNPWRYSDAALPPSVLSAAEWIVAGPACSRLASIIRTKDKDCVIHDSSIGQGSHQGSHNVINCSGHCYGWKYLVNYLTDSSHVRQTHQLLSSYWLSIQDSWWLLCIDQDMNQVLPVECEHFEEPHTRTEECPGHDYWLYVDSAFAVYNS